MGLFVYQTTECTHGVITGRMRDFRLNLKAALVHLQINNPKQPTWLFAELEY